MPSASANLLYGNQVVGHLLRKSVLLLVLILTFQLLKMCHGCVNSQCLIIIVVC